MRLIRKNDVFLVCGILLVALSVAAFSALNTAPPEPGAAVKVVSGRDVQGVYALEEDREITISTEGGLNVLKIAAGTAKMIEANCPNGDCLRQAAVSRAGQSIVCLPNKALVTVEEASWPKE